MKKNKAIIKSIVFLSTIFVFFVFIQFAHAQCSSSNTTYCPIVTLPFSNSGNGINVSGSGTSLSDYFNSMIKIVIGLLSVLAVIMVVIGGIRYMISDVAGEKSSAKNQMTNAIFGLILALSSYLLLNTINPNLVTLHIGIPTTTTTAVQDLTFSAGGSTFTGAITCTSTESSSYLPVTISINGATSTFQYPMVVGMPWLPDNGSPLVIMNSNGSGLLSMFSSNNPFPDWQGKNVSLIGDNTRGLLNAVDIADYGVTGGAVQINKANCLSIGLTGCTSVYGLDPDFVDSIKDLEGRCPGTAGCGLVVTGGTECWLHKSHGPNIDAVDLSKSTALSTYVTSATDAIGSRQCVSWPGTLDSDCAGNPLMHWVYTKQIIDNGSPYKLKFYDEGDHYHVIQADVTTPASDDEGDE